MAGKLPKTRKGRRPQPASKAASPGPRLALSSGQAARCCLVSPDTIGNWIEAGRLPAQRTAGGQYRIRADELRRFMQVHRMRTDLLDCELGRPPSCWEFWADRIPDQDAARAGRARRPVTACADCPVCRSGAAACHEVRPLLPGGTLRSPSCSDCAYSAALARAARQDP